nr:hypothetical protein [Tanacetum cinerariifolium]
MINPLIKISYSSFYLWAEIGRGPDSKVESSNDEENLGDDASKQGRIEAIDVDEDITLVNVQDDVEMFDVNDLGGEEVFVAEQEVVKDVKENVVEEVVNAAQVVKGIVIQEREEPSKSTTTTTVPKQQSSNKGKGIMIEEPVKPKKKYQIKLDEEAAKRLQADFNEEERLARERAKKEQETNIFLIETWDDIQTKINTNHQLAERFQAQETELVKGKEKRAGEELIQESTKKQKVEDDKETAEHKQLMEIILDKKEVAIDAIPLAVKSSRIVDWKIHKEGKQSYYQIVRADRRSQMYMVFSKMLESFDREDLEDLYKLVKVKFKSTRPVEDLDLLLWGDLKTMFEPHVEDKTYPLTPPTLSMMLKKKLQIDYQSEMAYRLLKLIKKQPKK